MQYSVLILYDNIEILFNNLKKKKATIFYYAKYNTKYEKKRGSTIFILTQK